MTQRKLTDRELEDVMVARQGLRRIFSFATEAIVICQLTSIVDAMAYHGTTDGNPYVEPAPPIPDDYRLAVDSDKGRRDCLYFDGDDWKPRLRQYTGAAFHERHEYIVPADRTPTDEDAKSRPEVMVRNRDDCKWQKYTLLAVFESRPEIRFMCIYDNGSTYATWKQCRHLYPGE